MALVIMMAVEDRFPAICGCLTGFFLFLKITYICFFFLKKKQRIDTEKGYAYKLG
jgi:hypothetical protein